MAFCPQTPPEDSLQCSEALDAGSQAWVERPHLREPGCLSLDQRAQGSLLCPLGSPKSWGFGLAATRSMHLAYQAWA